MLDLRPFMPGDLIGFDVQPQQAEDFSSHGGHGVPAGQSWTALYGARPVACGGLVEQWSGRAYAWSLLTREAGPHLLSLTREIRSLLDAAPFARIEMAVDADFKAGHRWAKLLGFECETPEPMQKFFPNGRAANLYARIR